MKNNLIKKTIIQTAIAATITLSSNSYAEKVVPAITLPEAPSAALDMAVTKLNKTMSDGNIVEFWVFCEGGANGGGGRGGNACSSTTQTLPSPTLTMTASTQTSVNLNMMMAPQEDGTLSNGRTDYTRPYIGHTIHLHGLDMESEFDGVPETYQEDFGGPEKSSIPLRDGFNYKINSDPGNLRVDTRFVGSHMYHCHVHTVKHLEMGMYGAFVVRSEIDPQFINNKSKVSFTDEWIMMLSTVDPAYHLVSASFDSDVFADYNPKYFLINGEEGNDTAINPALSKTISLNGQTKNLVIRLMGMHSTNATFKIMSGTNLVPFTVYNLDGFALNSPRFVESVELSPGQTKDVMISLDKAAVYNPQIEFGDLRFNATYDIVDVNNNEIKTSIVKTELIVTP